MRKLAAQMADRFNRAVQSGKLKPDGNYTVLELAAIIGTTRAELSQAVNREFGSITGFCTHLGFSGMR